MRASFFSAARKWFSKRETAPKACLPPFHFQIVSNASQSERAKELEEGANPCLAEVLNEKQINLVEIHL